MKPKTQAPASYTPSAELQEWFVEKRIPGDIEEHTERWLDYHKAKGSVFVDWDAAWRTWMRNQKKWAQEAAPVLSIVRPRQIGRCEQCGRLQIDCLCNAQHASNAW